MRCDNEITVLTCLSYWLLNLMSIISWFMLKQSANLLEGRGRQPIHVLEI